MKQLKLNMREKENLIIAIGCFIQQTKRQIRQGNVDKEVAEKSIMEFATLESKIERNLDTYSGG